MPEGFVTALTGSVNVADLFGAITPLVPWVGGLIVFSLSIHFVRRSISGASKGKARI